MHLAKDEEGKQGHEDADLSKLNSWFEDHLKTGILLLTNHLKEALCAGKMCQEAPEAWRQTSKAVTKPLRFFGHDWELNAC